MKTKILSAVTLLLLLPFLSAQAWAQDDGPPIPLDEYGLPDASQIELTFVRTERFCEYCANLPVVGEVGFNLRYNVFEDNYGNTWVMPDQFTALYTLATHETPPGLDSNMAGYHYTNEIGNIIGSLGGWETLGISTDMASEALGYQVQNLQDLSNEGALALLRYAGSSVDFWFNAGTALIQGGLLQDQLQEGMIIGLEQYWANAGIVLIYGYDPFQYPNGFPTPVPTGTPPATGTPQPTPTRTPRPTMTPVPTRTPEPTPINCPAPTVTQHRPSGLIVEYYPPNPVVVGQGGQGLDLTVTVITYPAVYHWWERQRVYECERWYAELYGTPHGNNGHCCPENNPDCDDDYWWLPQGWECIEHREIYPDIIDMAALHGTANLHKSSIEWIQTDLAQKYPGAEVKHPNWSVGSNAQPLVLADGRCILQAEVLHFGFEDPGYYDVAFSGRTAGTPYTPSRSFGDTLERLHGGPLAVYLLDTMLIR